MVKAKEFILSNFTKNFITLFLPFFVLISVIYLLKISKYSAKVNLELSDLAIIYSLYLPEILFSVIPITYIAALINTFAKLSSNNELISIFALSYSPLKLVKYLLPTSILLSIIFLILSLYIIPVSDQEINKFEHNKIYEAKLKIIPNTLSQNFNDKQVFVSKSNNNTLEDVVLFSNKNRNLEILLSKNAKIINNKNYSYIDLNSGTLYKYKDNNYQIVNFNNMKLYNNTKMTSIKFLSIKKYWQKYHKFITYAIVISLLPIYTLLAGIAFGIFNNRYEKNISSIYILISVLMVYIPSLLVKSSGSVALAISVIVVWLIFSIYIFNKKILKRY